MTFLLPLVHSTQETPTASEITYKLICNREITTDNNAAAPFSCPSSAIQAQSIQQEAGTSYNKWLGDDRFQGPNGKPAKKPSDIQIPVETGMVADSRDDFTDGNVFRILPSENAVGYRHKGGLNILWVDGHVQRHSQAYITAGKNGFEDYYYLHTKP